MDRFHKKLDAWKSGMMLVNDIYQRTASFPKKEMYCLISQMRRAAISIPSNIAEGAARNSSKEFKQFLNIARSSLMELDTQVDISLNVGYLDECDVRKLSELIEKEFALLSGLIKSVEKKIK